MLNKIYQKEYRLISSDVLWAALKTKEVKLNDLVKVPLCLSIALFHVVVDDEHKRIILRRHNSFWLKMTLFVKASRYGAVAEYSITPPLLLIDMFSLIFLFFLVFIMILEPELIIFLVPFSLILFAIILVNRNAANHLIRIIKEVLDEIEDR